MDPISLIVGALASGAAGGLKDTASTTVSDGYRGLRELARRRLAGHSAAETVLIEHETAPVVWQAPPVAELKSAGADTDEAVTSAAQLVARVHQTSTRSGTYVVGLTGAQRLHVGDGRGSRP